MARLLIVKKKTYWPMAFCIHENKAIAVSRIKCHGKVKVHWNHFEPHNAKFLPGYMFSLRDKKLGDQIFCPYCGRPLDFRMWMSDTEPDIK